jgi:hypothetical protein
MSGRDDGVGKEGGRKEDSGASDVGWEEGDLDFLNDLVDGHAFHETHHGEELVHGRAQKEEYVSSRRGKSRERLKSEKDKGRVRGTRKSERDKGREGEEGRSEPSCKTKVPRASVGQSIVAQRGRRGQEAG